MLLFYVFLILLIVGAIIQGNKKNMELDRRRQKHVDRFPKTKWLGAKEIPIDSRQEAIF